MKAMTPTKKGQKSKGFTDEEKAAMRARIREQKEEAGESALLAAIAAMRDPDRALAKRLHAIVTSNAPTLSPTTWYGMPAYANKDGKAVCFFQAAQKFRSRYATLGFSDKANLDEGHIWPVYFALTELTAAEEAKIVALLKRAVG